MTVRLKEIAEAAGVQSSTVSLVLRDHPKARSFKPATREQILTLAEKMGYYRNPNRTPGAKKCRNIAFLLAGDIQDGWSNHYFTSFLNGVENACREHNYNLLISRCREREFEERFFPSRNDERVVDGAIVIGYMSSALISALQRNHLPCVAIGDDLATGNAGITTFAVNAVGMYMQILRYLASMNHEHVAILFEDRERQHQVAALVRAELMQSELAGKMHLDIQFNNPNYNDIENGQYFLWSLVDLISSDRPTAVVCNERVGIGILGALPKYNLSCPEDLSLVVGCDNTVCEVSSPPLTAVRMESDLIGYEAADFLLRAIGENRLLNETDSRNDFKTRLIIRDSVKSVEHIWSAIG